MGSSVAEVVTRADAVVSAMGHAPSTLWQYRWAWSRIEEFCTEQEVAELTEDVVVAFLQFVATQHREGRIKEWKRKLLRRAVLVLSEVATTGTFTWKLFRAAPANHSLDPVFGPVQEQFEQWLGIQGLAPATTDLYATVSRTVLAWLPQHGVADVRALRAGDVSGAVVLLSTRYAPGSMRTVVTALRVLCRFLEETGRCSRLVPAVPSTFSRRVRTVATLPTEQVEQVVATPDPATPVGRRNRAMLLLAARTGLRPSDIAGLRLGDIDWAQARITLTQHKSGTVLTLPLLADVGAAIAEYLLTDRGERAADDHVFLRSQAPHIALTGSDLYHVASAAFAAAGTAPKNGTGRGMRVLRASLATRMLQEDTPLPVISGALGHAGTDSVKHYLTGDEARMRDCCLDFAGIEPPAVLS